VHETSPDEVFYPVAAYWGHPLGDRVTVGFGFYSPFGLSVEWEDPETFSGRFISTRVAITPFYFNPSVAFDVSPRLRIGGGVTAVHASVDLNRNVGQPNPTDFGPDVLDLGTVELDGSNGLDYGFNAGLQLDVTETVALGVTYRGGVETAIDGDADFTFTGTGTGLDPQLGPLFPEDQGVTTEIPFPAQLVVGFAVEVSESVVLEADLGWTRWSDLDQLSLRFEDPDLDEVIPQHWEDAFFLRTGAEIALRPGTDLRFGYYYDETPQITESVSPLLPDNDRHGFSAGVGWAKGRWRFDVFGLLLLVQDRETEGVNRDGFEGVYDSGTQIAGLSLGFRY
jgi:long-chain fatty acid transport protein